MFKKIIVVTEVSPEADALIDCMGGLKDFGIEEVLVLQYISLQESVSIALTYTAAAFEESLQEQKDILEKQGFKVHARSVTNPISSELNKIAEEEGYSLIVLGAEKHSAMGEIFFGGLAYDVIHHSRKPVLLIRLMNAPKGDSSFVKAVSCDIGNHILFVTDFSANAENAFSYLQEMVLKGAKKITLLHVQDKSHIDPHLSERLEEFNEIDNNRLLELKKEILKDKSIQVDIKLAYGSPAVEILRSIKELNIQLVVMGSQGRGYVKELFLGSVSNNVARNSDASVLLIPAKRENK
jgi:nucleotide-binding universal stress UspA family protein